MKEEELVDYLIDGIPDKVLQNQARMQHFEKKDMLLRAFDKIKLRQDKGKQERDNNNYMSDELKQEKLGGTHKDENKVEGVRCFNCNQSGHRAKECAKPRRDRGSCYEFGEQGHVYGTARGSRKKRRLLRRMQNLRKTLRKSPV